MPDSGSGPDTNGVVDSSDGSLPVVVAVGGRTSDPDVGVAPGTGPAVDAGDEDADASGLPLLRALVPADANSQIATMIPTATSAPAAVSTTFIAGVNGVRAGAPVRAVVGSTGSSMRGPQAVISTHPPRRVLLPRYRANSRRRS
ncbi:hypothetical protein GCM10025760_00050 [Microbacterium yannicii]|uniref:Uncharacterized protein n=1 Tax=Microbacterium yannicii TaxID=671622 RepID=A0ABP9LQE6_9MICO